MNFKMKKIEVKCRPCEEKDIVVVLKPEERRCCIHGVVKFPNMCPVEGAVVKLFKKRPGCDPCELIPVTFTFTDKCGQFLFGVDCEHEFVIKVFFFEEECEHHMEKKEHCED